MRDPLLLPAVSAAVGIAIGRLFAFGTVEAAWPAVALGVLAWIAHRLRRGLFLTCAALSLVFVGMFAEAWHRPGPPPEIDAGSRETVILEGCVVEPTELSSDRAQFTLELAPRASARVTQPLGDGEQPPRLAYGERVEIEARIRRPHNFNNPGSFDYAGYLARRDIYWTATMRPGARTRALPGLCGSRFMAAVFALRTAAVERIERLYGSDSYSAGMMEAILIGESSKLEKVWTENFRRTGTFHALVISGMHVVVLAGVLLFLLRLCALPQLAALTATAGAAWIYALVSGMGAPVARAAGGFTLYLIARFFYRRGRVMNLLAGIALVYLLCDPGQMFEASFQLSFLCVAAIGALAAPLIEMTSGPIARGLRNPANVAIDAHLEPRSAQFRVELRLAAETASLWTRVPRRWAIAVLAALCRAAIYAFEMALISATVQVGLALPMAEYFHRVSFTGLTANLLIVPLLNCVVPVGFAAIFTGWRWLAAAAGSLLKLAAKIASWHASVEPAWRVPDPPLWLAIAFTAALVVLAALVESRRWRWPAMAAALAAFGLVLGHPGAPQIEPRTLELSTIDVGQGDSLLVVFPEGKIMAIDGGGVLQFGRQRKSNLDTGEDVVSPYLWSRGITRIDILVATHAHADHSGGIAALIENFHPRELWTGANPLPDVLSRAARFGVRVFQKRASAPFRFSGATVEFLSPPADYASTKPGNNDSLAMRISYGSRAFLLTGDMERPMEASLLGRPLHADVLKVGHHGSKTSTIQPFLDEVAPSVAVISAGFENSFGHPSREVLERLAARHAAILRTDYDGLVTVRTDGRRLWFDTMLWRGESAWWSGERVFNWALAGGW